MSALRELQRHFSAAIFATDTEAEEAAAELLPHLEEPAPIAHRRFAAYRRGVFSTLIGALRASYPVTERIVGETFFRQMAQQFVQDCPSASGDLNEYGERFASFVAAHEPAACLPYLPDVARLEWLVQTVFFAADAPAQDLSVLMETPPEQWADLSFTLDPAHAGFDSRWPLASIWRVNQDNFAGDPAVDFERSECVLILRDDGKVHVTEAGRGEIAFIDALARKAALGEALMCATESDPGFDLQAVLQRLLRCGLLRAAHLTT